jgi:hypothetical protein
MPRFIYSTESSSDRKTAYPYLVGAASQPRVAAVGVLRHDVVHHLQQLLDPLVASQILQHSNKRSLLAHGMPNQVIRATEVVNHDQ